MNGRGSKQRYIGCPHCLYDHPAFHTLSYMATCLWVDMLRQYNGFNNGNIAAKGEMISNTQKIDVSRLAAGNYFVNLRDLSGKKMCSDKFTIAR